MCNCPECGSNNVRVQTDEEHRRTNYHCCDCENKWSKAEIDGIKENTLKDKKFYTIPAVCLAGILLMLITVFYGGKPAEASEQASTAITETTETTHEEKEPFTLAMVPEYSGNAYVDINDDVPFFSEDELTDVSFQEYWPLDELGRCTGAFACIGPDTLPSKARENASTIEPTGWQPVQYDSVEGGYLYNRCHLIGYQLTGQSANEKNLITGTRYMNMEGMLPFENSVRMYVEGTGNHVLYRVRPYYNGDDLLATGVLMEAKSIEDPQVQFCAFCYNVQPGVEIDYATGFSTVKKATESEAVLSIVSDFESGGGESVTRSIEDESKTRPAEDKSFTDESEKDTSEDEPDEITYVMNTNTKKFHKPYCSSVKDIKDKNKRETTLSREEIINQGYQPCKRCNP